MISACVGTAGLDIIVDVVAVGDVADLGRITSELISGCADPGEIAQSETLAFMDLCNKRVSLPEGYLFKARRVQARRALA